MRLMKLMMKILLSLRKFGRMMGQNETLIILIKQSILLQVFMNKKIKIMIKI